VLLKVGVGFAVVHGGIVVVQVLLAHVGAGVQGHPSIWEDPEEQIGIVAALHFVVLGLLLFVVVEQFIQERQQLSSTVGIWFGTHGDGGIRPEVDKHALMALALHPFVFWIS
jgi:hypothetical protein